MRKNDEWWRDASRKGEKPPAASWKEVAREHPAIFTFAVVLCMSVLVIVTL